MLANAGDAFGQMMGTEAGPSAAAVLGMAGRSVGQDVCNLLVCLGIDPDAPSQASAPFDPDDTTEAGDPYQGGMSLPEMGPSLEGGYSQEPNSSPVEGTYLGEVDDPSFLQGTNQPSDENQSISPSTAGDNQSTGTSSSSSDYWSPGPSLDDPTTTSLSPDTEALLYGGRPPDDGTGPVGPNADVAYLASVDTPATPGGDTRPPDEGTGPVGPNASVAYIAETLSSFDVFALSRQGLR